MFIPETKIEKEIWEESEIQTKEILADIGIQNPTEDQLESVRLATYAGYLMTKTIGAKRASQLNLSMSYASSFISKIRGESE